MNLLNNIIVHSRNKEKNIREFIIILYSVGVIGTAIPFTRDIFISLTPFVLLISLLILYLFHEPSPSLKTLIVFSFIYILSLATEMTGVNTGIPFGDYTYGRGLGVRLFGTPVIIGLNWVLLIYCTHIIAEQLMPGNLLKIAGASSLMLLYDIIMEQVAPEMDMWFFEDDVIPLINYISWFLLASFFHLLLKITDTRFENRLAPLLFISQLAFFFILMILFKLT